MHLIFNASVAKQVNATDLKSVGNILTGSIPVTRTNYRRNKLNYLRNTGTLLSLLGNEKRFFYFGIEPHEYEYETLPYMMFKYKKFIYPNSTGFILFVKKGNFWEEIERKTLKGLMSAFNKN